MEFDQDYFAEETLEEGLDASAGILKTISRRLLSIPIFGQFAKNTISKVDDKDCFADPAENMIEWKMLLKSISVFNLKVIN